MAIPFAPYTFTDAVANDFNAARANAMSTAIKDAQLMPCARVTHSVAQAITTGTRTALAFNTERFDQFSGAADTQHDTVTNNSRLTAKYAGVYYVAANIEWASNATGTRNVEIRVNGTTLIAVQNSSALSANVHQQSVSGLYAMAVNDYFEVTVVQTSGGNLNVNVNGNFSPEFMMARIG